ncbi:very short patch repair endonuclease [Granulosicoccaceae sp. 1_MG-2023]|nr:very short patch repair endonuclease [Granulosicoccaceae sp. 1_MG-2023]
MTDVHDKEVRSRNMAAIRGTGTKPELWLRTRLHHRGYRYRVNFKSLPGRPDLVFPKYNAVIFINGCFWHRHDCPAFKLPKTRTPWWDEKLGLNRQRDIINHARLLKLGWRCFVLWECALKGPAKLSEERVLTEVESWLRYGGKQAELRGYW